jgi:hypothetical protein
VCLCDMDVVAGRQRRVSCAPSAERGCSGPCRTPGCAAPHSLFSQVEDHAEGRTL